MSQVKIIAGLGQKGGSGKSTTLISLASCAVIASQKVAVIDIDPQCSISTWGDLRADNEDAAAIKVIAIPPNRLAKGIAQATDSEADLILIDTAPHNSEGILAAARAADLCVVPCRPSLLDLAAITTTLDLCDVAGGSVALVINAIRTPKQLLDLRLVLSELAECSELRNLCPIPIGDRAIYARAINRGLGVIEAEPNSKAAAEAKRLYTWIVSKC